MEERTSEYPIDTRHLNKGDRIEAAQISAAFNVKVDTKAFRLALMRVRAHLELRFADRDEVVTLAEDDGAIMILTDAEAAVYNHSRVWGYVKRAAAALARQRGVNRANLDDKQRGKHDRALEVNGRAIMAAQRERAMPVLSAVVRQTPGRARRLVAELDKT